MNRLRLGAFRCCSMRLALFDFQACSIDHSDISPFRINNLQSCLKGNIGDCDKSSNVPRSLTGFSSIAASLLLPRRMTEARQSWEAEVLQTASKSAYREIVG